MAIGSIWNKPTPAGQTILAPNPCLALREPGCCCDFSTATWSSCQRAHVAVAALSPMPTSLRRILSARSVNLLHVPARRAQKPPRKRVEPPNCPPKHVATVSKAGSNFLPAATQNPDIAGKNAIDVRLVDATNRRSWILVLNEGFNPC